MEVVLLLMVLGVGFAGFRWYQRRQRRLSLDRQLHRLTERIRGPFAETLSRRQQQVQRSLEQTREKLLHAEITPQSVEVLLPRFHQQIVKLEQDQQLHQSVEEVHQQLSRWVARLESARPGSEAFELQEVARNALRISTGLTEEGELAQARDTAQEALVLLRQQHDALSSTHQRVLELLARAQSLQRDAEEANAAILVRAAWVRMARLRDELEAQLRDERPSDALVLVTRLLSQLEELEQELVEQLVRQVVEHRSQVSSALSELLLWPPGGHRLQDEVRALLEGLELQGGPLPRSIGEARRTLEALTLALERSQALGELHEQQWSRYVAELAQRLRASTLRSLRSCASLPPDLFKELRELDRLRTRLQSRMHLAPGWQLSEEVQEILEREAALRALLEALERRSQLLLERVSAGVEGLRHYAEAIGLDAERMSRFDAALRRLTERFAQRDLEVLLPDLTRFEEALERQAEAGREQALALAVSARAALKSSLTQLTQESLLEYLPSAAPDPASALRALDRAIEARDVLRMIEAGGEWEAQAPALLLLARSRRAKQLWEGLRTRLEPAPELSALPEVDRKPLEAERLLLVEQHGQLSEGRAEPHRVEETIHRIEEELKWLLLRARKALARYVQACLAVHQQATERLTHGTVQFYLGEDARVELQVARALLAESANLVSQDVPVQLEVLPRLQESTRRLEERWEEAVPRARRFFEKQLLMLEIDLEASVSNEEASRTETSRTEASRIEASLDKHGVSQNEQRVSQDEQGVSRDEQGVSRDEQRAVVAEQARLKQAVRRELEALHSPAWSEVAGRIESLSGEVRSFIDRAETQRDLEHWLRQQRPGLEELCASLEQVGATAELEGLRTVLERLESSLGDSASAARAERARQELMLARSQGERALKGVVEELERSRREQHEVSRWQERLSARKQDMDWIRSCMKDLMTPGVEGLNLRVGLQALQQMQRALEAISLDLGVVETQDRAFQAWIAGVRARAEGQLERRFKEVIEALHERPPNAQVLCSEVLAHIDAILSAHTADPVELARYQRLQREGDSFHKLFKKRFSFQSRT